MILVNPNALTVERKDTSFENALKKKTGQVLDHSTVKEEAKDNDAITITIKGRNLIKERKVNSRRHLINEGQEGKETIHHQNLNILQNQ